MYTQYFTLLKLTQNSHSQRALNETHASSCCRLHMYHGIVSNCVKCTCGNSWQWSQNVESHPMTCLHGLELIFLSVHLMCGETNLEI